MDEKEKDALKDVIWMENYYYLEYLLQTNQKVLNAVRTDPSYLKIANEILYDVKDIARAEEFIEKSKNYNQLVETPEKMVFLITKIRHLDEEEIGAILTLANIITKL